MDKLQGIFNEIRLNCRLDKLLDKKILLFIRVPSLVPLQDLQYRDGLVLEQMPLLVLVL